MTLKERIIVETYTGIVMTTGNERDAVSKYISELIGRPVYLHELADKSIVEELQKKSKSDFINLCKDTGKPLMRDAEEILYKYICSGCSECAGCFEKGIQHECSYYKEHYEWLTGSSPEEACK